jgi:hypothetical protein
MAPLTRAKSNAIIKEELIKEELIKEELPCGSSSFVVVL